MKGKTAPNFIIVLVLGVIVASLAILFLGDLLNIVFPKEARFDIDLQKALSSTEALRCAIDFVATDGNKLVPTCSPYEVSLETEEGQSRAAYFGTSTAGCYPEKDFINERNEQETVFNCQNKDSNFINTVQCKNECKIVPDTVGDCKKENYVWTDGFPTSCKTTKTVCDWTCTVKEFELPQKIYLKETLNQIPLVKDLVQLPGISHLFAGSEYAQLWLGATGEPKFSVYYETFPQGFEQVWTYDTQEDILTAVAIGGILNLGTGGLKVAKTIGVGGLKLTLSKITGGRLFEQVTGKTVRESITKVALREFGGKIAVNRYTSAKATAALSGSEGMLEIAGKEFLDDITKTSSWKNLGAMIKSRLGNRLKQQGVPEVEVNKQIDSIVGKVVNKYQNKLQSQAMLKEADGRVWVDALKDEFAEAKFLDRNAMRGVRLDDADFKNILDESIEEVRENFAHDTRFARGLKEFQGDVKNNPNIEIRDISGNPTIGKIMGDVRSSFYEDFINKYNRKLTEKSVLSKLKDYVDKELIPQNERVLKKVVGKDVKDGSYANLVRLAKFDPDAKIILENLEKEADEIAADAYRLFTKDIVLVSEATKDEADNFVKLTGTDDTFVEYFFKNIEKNWNKLSSDEFDAESVNRLRAKVTSLRDKLPQLAKGLTGYPTDAGINIDTGKRTALLGTIVASAYFFSMMDSQAEKYDTCGGNSLCLHMNRFLGFEIQNYKFELSKDADFFVNSKIKTIQEATTRAGAKISDTFLGWILPKERWRGVLVSPCKADIQVQKDTQKCEQFVSSSKIAYQAFRSGCVCTWQLQPRGQQPGPPNLIAFIPKESIEKNYGGECPSTERYLEDPARLAEQSYINQPNFYVYDKILSKEDKELCNLEKARLSITGIGGYHPEKATFVLGPFMKDFPQFLESSVIDSNLCRTYESKSYNTCAQTHFYQQPESKGIPQDELRIRILNLAKNYEGKEDLVSTCTKDTFTEGFAKDKQSLMLDVVKKPDESEFPNNYCLPSKTGLANYVDLSCQIGTLAGSIALMGASFGTAAPALLYAAGSAGVACGKIAQTASQWPQQQPA